jgi:predicted DNA-binding protein (UPF0278 family)
MPRKARKPPPWKRENPRLRTTRILVWVYKQTPERFTAKAIAKQFRISQGEANRRIGYMIIWGAVRRVGQLEANRAGRREIGYEITKWGRKYAKDR